MAGAFVMFIIGSYALSFVPGIEEVFIKGGILSVFLFPPMFYHFNDPKKYQFHMSKDD